MERTLNAEQPLNAGTLHAFETSPDTVPAGSAQPRSGPQLSGTAKPHNRPQMSGTARPRSDTRISGGAGGPQ